MDSAAVDALVALKLDLSHETPIVYGVLSVSTLSHARELAEGNLPRSWADGALVLLKYKRATCANEFAPGSGAF